MSDQCLHLELWLRLDDLVWLQGFLYVRVVHKLGDLGDAGGAVVLRALHHLAPAAQWDAASDRQRRHRLAGNQLRRLVAVERVVLIHLEYAKVGVDRVWQLHGRVLLLRLAARGPRQLGGALL